TRSLPASATNTVCPPSATATPAAELNWLGPDPLLPKVVCGLQPLLDLVQTEMRALAKSATQTVCPSLSTATLCGRLNWVAPDPRLPKVVWLVHSEHVPPPPSWFLRHVPRPWLVVVSCSGCSARF